MELNAGERVGGVFRLSLSAVPFLLLPYDSITSIVGADAAATSETLPATALFSVCYIIMRGFMVQTSERSYKVLSWLFVAALIIIVVTLLNTAVESMTVVRADTDVRQMVAIRQLASLALGLSSYVMFQDAVLHLGLRASMKWVLRGAIPVLWLAMVQIALRENRVEGLSAEPSHFADFLVFTVLPACVAAGLGAFTRLRNLSMSALALLETFSTTGYIKCLGIAMAHFSVSGKWFRGILLILAMVGLVTLFFLLFPDNYAVTIVLFIWNNYSATGTLVTASLIDRFFGFVGPLSLMGDWHSWLGYGLGGDTVYFDRMFSPEIADVIRAAKGDIVAISSLQGKMLMYGGVLGYAAYLAAWVVAWRGTRRGDIARVILPAVFMASLFSLGPIFLPYVWLWLAIGAVSDAGGNLKAAHALPDLSSGQKS